MEGDILHFLADLFTSAATWIIFYGVVVLPLLSWKITKDFSAVLECFNINLNDKEKKTCRNFLNTLLSAVYITFLLFHLYVFLLRE